jgi:RecA-family ATPase
MLQAELPKAMFRERIEQLVNLSKNGLKKSDIQFATVLDMKLNKQAGAAVLTSAVKQLQLNLLIIDPLYKVLSGNVSDWDEMSKLCDNLDNICRTLNCSIWLVHHRRKSQLQDGHVVDLGTDELIGSSQLKDWMDTCLRLDWYNKSADLLKLTFSKCRNSRTRLHPTIVRFNRQDLTFSAVEDIDISADQLKD